MDENRITIFLRETGMVMNLTDLKAVLEEQVMQHLDHRNIDR
jgi:6-pyruvoyl-tetrahydropterin synthase